MLDRRLLGMLRLTRYLAAEQASIRHDPWAHSFDTTLPDTGGIEITLQSIFAYHPKQKEQRPLLPMLEKKSGPFFSVEMAKEHSCPKRIDILCTGNDYNIVTVEVEYDIASSCNWTVSYTMLCSGVSLQSRKGSKTAKKLNQNESFPPSQDLRSFNKNATSHFTGLVWIAMMRQ